jgi:two-component system sensor histidine kinase GlrK
MKFPRPRSLNGLILVGFGLVALPLLVAVVWALVNLDRLAEQSEKLVVTGVSSAENNRLLAQQVDSLERVSRQYLVLGNEDSPRYRLHARSAFRRDAWSGCCRMARRAPTPARHWTPSLPNCGHAWRACPRC